MSHVCLGSTVAVRRQKVKTHAQRLQVHALFSREQLGHCADRVRVGVARWPLQSEQTDLPMGIAHCHSIAQRVDSDGGHWAVHNPRRDRSQRCRIGQHNDVVFPKACNSIACESPLHEADRLARVWRRLRVLVRFRRIPHAHSSIA